MHYGTFDEAVAKWHVLARRVDLGEILLTFTDEAVTEEHVARFAAPRRSTRPERRARRAFR